MQVHVYMLIVYETYIDICVLKAPNTKVHYQRHALECLVVDSDCDKYAGKRRPLLSLSLSLHVKA